MSRVLNHVAATVAPKARPTTTVLLVLLFFPIVACGPSSPEGKIAQVRDGYTVELNSWRALDNREEEAAMDIATEAGEAVASAAEAAVAGGEEGTEEEGTEEEMDAGPEPQDVLFDLIVYFRGRKSLPGITVDVAHAGAGEQEKATYHQYIETGGMINGDTRQVDFVLEGLELEDGDVFAVELVQGIPADTGKYREFSEPAP